MDGVPRHRRSVKKASGWVKYSLRNAEPKWRRHGSRVAGGRLDEDGDSRCIWSAGARGRCVGGYQHRSKRCIYGKKGRLDRRCFGVPGGWISVLAARWPAGEGVIRRRARIILNSPTIGRAFCYASGMVMEIRVPLPGAVSIVKRPPSFSILSLMIRSP